MTERTESDRVLHCAIQKGVFISGVVSIHLSQLDFICIHSKDLYYIPFFNPSHLKLFNNIFRFLQSLPLHLHSSPWFHRHWIHFFGLSCTRKKAPKSSVTFVNRGYKLPSSFELIYSIISLACNQMRAFPAFLLSQPLSHISCDTFINSLTNAYYKMMVNIIKASNK
jgi:hypothetical protein